MHNDPMLGAFFLHVVMLEQGLRDRAPHLHVLEIAGRIASSLVSSSLQGQLQSLDGVQQPGFTL